MKKLIIIPAYNKSESIKNTVEDILKHAPEFDYVVIDCPAGIEHGFKNAIAGAEQAIVVTTPEVSAVRDADRIIGMLEAAGIADPMLIVNRIRTNMVKSGDMMSVEDILEILAIKLLGIVPDDDQIVISTNRGEPTALDDSSRPGQAFRNIARRIVLHCYDGAFARKAEV